MLRGTVVMRGRLAVPGAHGAAADVPRPAAAARGARSGPRAADADRTGPRAGPPGSVGRRPDHHHGRGCDARRRRRHRAVTASPAASPAHSATRSPAGTSTAPSRPPTPGTTPRWSRDPTRGVTETRAPRPGSRGPPRGASSAAGRSGPRPRPPQRRVADLIAQAERDRSTPERGHATPRPGGPPRDANERGEAPGEAATRPQARSPDRPMPPEAPVRPNGHGTNGARSDGFVPRELTPRLSRRRAGSLFGRFDGHTRDRLYAPFDASPLNRCSPTDGPSYPRQRLVRRRAPTLNESSGQRVVRRYFPADSAPSSPVPTEALPERAAHGSYRDEPSEPRVAPAWRASGYVPPDDGSDCSGTARAPVVEPDSRGRRHAAGRLARAPVPVGAPPRRRSPRTARTTGPCRCPSSVPEPGPSSPTPSGIPSEPPTRGRRARRDGGGAGARRHPLVASWPRIPHGHRAAGPGPGRQPAGRRAATRAPRPARRGERRRPPARADRARHRRPDH